MKTVDRRGSTRNDQTVYSYLLVAADKYSAGKLTATLLTGTGGTYELIGLERYEKEGMR